MCVTEYMWRLESVFSFHEVPGIELRFSSWATSAFTHRMGSLAQSLFISDKYFLLSPHSLESQSTLAGKLWIGI